MINLIDEIHHYFFISGTTPAVFRPTPAGPQLGQRELRMCDSSSLTHRFFTYTDFSGARMTEQCACIIQYVETPGAVADIAVNIMNFECVENCDWKLRIYVGGCEWFERCCQRGWSTVSITIPYETVTADPAPPVHISVEHHVPDAEGALVEMYIIACKYYFL